MPIWLYGFIEVENRIFLLGVHIEYAWVVRLMLDVRSPPTRLGEREMERVGLGVVLWNGIDGKELFVFVFPRCPHSVFLSIIHLLERSLLQH